ncbi:MAG: chromosome segregation protein SMC [Treponema sp. CETP13]|nr:MAG: chromosome segregation protein SMC [Treponema sp. CETP13]
MFLKSLDIFGFKSFADRTHIEFADGITALLGPNGCGKSNVVDAVKWVLGEQGSKSLRADKMEDVIFNGTENRKAVNVAEVALTIYNNEGLLPLNNSEVTIKRRLYRSGEGEYWINNEQVRLKNVRELFWDTGVGKAAYSVMEQGKIDQILSSRPEDRRYLFEEAAGITRFKAKRAEANRKLGRTRENMKKVEAVLVEVKRSYDTLKVQSDKTIEYRKLRESIFNTDTDIQLLKLQGFRETLKNRESDVKKLEIERSEIQEKINTINKKLSSNMDEVNEMETELNNIQKKTIQLAVEEKGKSEQQKLYEESRNTAREKVHQLEGKKAGIEERIESLQEENDEQESVVREVKHRLEEIAKNIISFEKNIELASNQINENDRQEEILTQNINSLLSERAEYQKDLESITENIVTELDSKLKEAGYSTTDATKAKDQIYEKLEYLKVLASGRKKIFSDFVNLQNVSDRDIKKVAENTVKVFDDIEGALAQLETAVTVFSKNSPTFIDEFLSPEGIITKKRSIDKKIQTSIEEEAKKREQISNLKTTNSGLVAKIDEYKITLEDLRINQAKMKTRVEGAENQLKMLRRELNLQESALRELENELFTEQKRFDEIEDKLLELEGEISSIQREGLKLTEKLEKLEKSIQSRNSDVDGARGNLANLTATLGNYQKKIEDYHLQLNTAQTEIRNVQDHFRETNSREISEFEDRIDQITEKPVELKEKLVALRRRFNSLGQVNLMAPEEFGETKERYEFLSKQCDDLEKACEDLQRITEEIKAESTELFLETYNKIKKNFHNMFRRLFGGGRAELRLVDPTNVLESGIDIFAQPPGKKLENIALLSGGEKTMTAVGLLFATYMVRPSPFCLLDEIDAALDEQNVLRFVQMLREFGNMSQYIVITHNKKTVAAASTMLGVTMEESGISKVITIKLEEGSKVFIPEPEEFEEEEVDSEEGVVVPPHPPKRIHNPDGTITDPFKEELKKREIEKKKQEKEREILEKEAKKLLESSEGNVNSIDLSEEGINEQPET